MKHLYILILLIIPQLTTAQNIINSKNATTKYENLLSKSGVIYTTYKYKIGLVELVWDAYSSKQTDQLSLCIMELVSGTNKTSFLNISHNKSGKNSETFIELSNVKELLSSLISIRDLGKGSVPDGATPLYSYKTTDGVVVTYDGVVWIIRLETNSTDSIITSDIDPLIYKLKEAIQKLESI